jgi:membrane-associated protease RseP (regulator of RpoE activity)
MNKFYPYSPVTEFSNRTAHEPRQTIVQRMPQQVAPAQQGLSLGRILWHLLLLGLTALTTTFAGWFWLGGDGQQAMLFTFALLMILGSHELGHYIACRWYNVDATLPYFIPFPLSPVGTFGAFIRIKSPIPSRRALFDIGIAGPLAGFVFALPVAVIAHYFAEGATPALNNQGVIIYNDPLLFKFLIQLFHLPQHLDASLIWFSAWFGLLLTAFNLMPIGQLDGGHVIYALFGVRGHRAIGWLVYLATLAMAVYSWQTGGWMGWIVWAILFTVLMRAGHPPVLDEAEPLGVTRWLVALIGLLVFMLCFIPTPISF